MINNAAMRAYYIALSILFYFSCMRIYYNMREHDVRHISRGVELFNQAQMIQNTDLYGNVTNETIIVAVQVHDDVDSMVRLISSLSQAQNIEDTLIIFSHEFYSREMNDIIAKIRFAKVMQIFFPHSMQLHELEFPGDDVMNKYLASRNLTCREAKYTQIKHHWWWQASRIFNQLLCTDKFDGDVIFLEDFHHVSEDFVHMVKLLRASANKECSQCEMLALSAAVEPAVPNKVDDDLLHLPKIERERIWNLYDNNFVLTPLDFNKAEIMQWRQNIKILGLIFNRTAWRNIMEHRDQFCRHNDYHWECSLMSTSPGMKFFLISVNFVGTTSWFLELGRKKMLPQRSALMNLSLNRNRGPFHLLAAKTPRVLYVGKCVSPVENHGCNATSVDQSVANMFKSAKPYMYPKALTVTARDLQQGKIPYLSVQYGKFDYERDHELCIEIANVARRYYKDLFDYQYVRKNKEEPIFLLE